jgi:hypothetical protein
MNKKIVGSVLALVACCSLAWFAQAGDKQERPDTRSWADFLVIPEGASDTDSVDAYYGALLQRETLGMPFDDPIFGEKFRKAVADHHESRLETAITLASMPDVDDELREPGEQPEPMSFAEQRDKLREMADNADSPEQREAIEIWVMQADALASGIDPLVVEEMAKELCEQSWSKQTKERREARAAEAETRYRGRRSTMKRMNPETGKLETVPAVYPPE